MATKQIHEYDLATTIDASADFLLIDPASSGSYKRISRSTLLEITGSPVGTTDTQAITNKTLDNTNTITLKQSLFTLQDATDTTKQARFVLSGITTGNTRSYTLPNASGTLVDLASSQSLTNKTITGATISGGTVDNATITVDSIGEHTSAAGVTIDGVLLKDGVIVSPTITGATINSSSLGSPTISTPIISTPTVRNWNGWLDAAETWTYASATTLTVPSDATTKYAVGDRIKLTQSATIKYFVIIGVAATTLTITGGSDYTLTNNTVTSNYYSHEVNPVGYPDWFAYSATVTGFSSTTVALTRFRIIGRTLLLAWTISGTSNATSFSLTLPVTAATVANMFWQSVIYTIDNGTAGTGAEGAIIASAATSMNLAHNDNNAGWTATGTKAGLGSIEYPI